MLTLKRLSMALLVVASAACSQKEKPAFAPTVANQVIVPTYHLLAEQTGIFAQDSINACADNTINADEMKQLRHQWLVAMSAWQQAQVFHFGPVETNNMRWQFQFWPDRHNNTAKKIRALLAHEEPLTPQLIDEAGVVVEGFSALEYLLFDKANPPETFAQAGLPVQQRCVYLQHVTQKLADNSKVMAEQWGEAGDFFKTFTKPGPTNGEFPDEKAVIAVVLNSLVTTLEVIKADKLWKPLGVQGNKARPNIYATEAWRSTESMGLIRSNMVVIEHLLTLPEAGLLARLPADQSMLAKRISSQLEEVKTALWRININLNDALKSSSGQQLVKDLHDKVEALLQTCKSELPLALGVTLSFNGKDGD